MLIYGLPAFLAALLTGFIGCYSYIKVKDELIKYFALLAASLCIWSLGSALELATSYPSFQLISAKMQHLGADSSAVIWLALVLAYLGYQRYLTKTFFALLSIIPVLSLVLVFSNEYHGLIWKDIQLSTYPFNHLEYSRGLWFLFVLLPTNYGLILTGVGFLAYALISSHSGYKAQIFALQSAALIPLLCNAIYLFKLLPDIHIDLTPIGFTFSAVVIMKAFWGNKLLKHIPIFQRELFDASDDAIFILDKYFRLLDANSMAKAILPLTFNKAEGKAIFDIFQRLPFDESSFEPLRLMHFRLDQMIYDVHLLPIQRGLEPKAFILRMRDVQQQQLDAERLRELSAFQHALLELMHDLLPARPNPSFFKKVLDYAIQLIPGAEAGSVLVRQGNGQFYYVAQSGFSDQLKSVYFSEDELAIVYGLSQGKATILLENLDDLNAQNLDKPRRQTLLEAGCSASIQVSMVMPIYIGDTLKAVFALDNKHDKEAFDSEARYMGTAFANQVAAVLEKSLLEQKEQETAQANKLLASSESLLLKHESLEKLFLDLATNLLSSNWLALGGLNIYQVTEQGKLKARYLSDPLETVSPERLDLRKQCLHESRFLYRGEWGEEGKASIVVFPVILETRVWGLVEVHAPLPVAFGSEKLEFFHKLASSLALSLAKQRDREHLEQLASFRQSLIQLTDYVLKQDTEADFYQSILEQASSSIPGVEAASLLLKDPKGEFKFVAGIGYDNSKLEFIRLNLSECSSSKLSCFQDYTETSDNVLPFAYYLAKAGLKEALKSSLAVAIQVQGEIRAILALHHWTYSSGFNDLAREMTELFAAQLSTAMQSVELRKASQKAAYVQALLARLERLVLEQSQLDHFFPKLAQTLIEADNPSLCQVIIYQLSADKRQLKMMIQHQNETQKQALAAFFQEHGFHEDETKSSTLWQAIRQRQSIYFQDVSQHPDWLFFEENPVRSVLTCPLILGEDVWGMVEFASYQAYAFETEDKQLLEHISKSIELALLRQKEQEEREQLYASVLEREQKLSLLAENSSDIIALHALSGEFLYISPAAERLLGYSHEELLRVNPSTLIHPDDFRSVRRQLNRQLIRRSKTERFSYRICTKDGNFLWLETVMQLIESADGPRFSSSSRDMSAQKRMEEELRYHAMYDTLTGLPNRSLLLDRIEHVLKRSWRTGEQFALLFLDLNRFKMINDSLGHHVGDELLKAVARRLELSLRPSDTVARLGGDEFCLLLEDLESETQLLGIIERLHLLLSRPLHIDGKDIFSSSSIGAVMNQRYYEKAEDMLRDADTAMYRAKFKQLDYALFDTSMHQEVVHKLGLETDLRYALAKGELYLVYQPIVDLKTKQLVGLEALLRWQHPTKGAISPDQFIPLAEENGFIAQIDNWVLEQACAELSQYQKNHPVRLSLGVNIAAKSFEQAGFCQRVLGILEKAQLDGSYLKLELTERTLMQDTVAQDTLAALRAKGVQIQVDDFGTGYSSLNYLHTLPIDSIKIDRSFVRALEQSDSAIVETILALAKQLDLKVIAEGIETPTQLAILQELNCDFGQGYLFSAADQLETVLALPELLPQSYSHKGVRVSVLP